MEIPTFALEGDANGYLCRNEPLVYPERKIRRLQADLGRRDCRLDMVDQRIRQFQPTGQKVQIAALRPGIRIDCQTGRRVDLDALLLGSTSGHQCIEVDRVGKLL